MQLCEIYYRNTQSIRTGWPEQTDQYAASDQGLVLFKLPLIQQ